MTCEEYEEKSTDLWNKWCDESDTTDPQAWDKACESYMNAMDELRQSFGHHPRRPGQRPH